MKISTFNLRDLFGDGPFNSYGEEFVLTSEFVQRRVDSLSETINRMDPDLLFVQEVGSEEVLKRIAKQTGAGYEVFTAKPDKRGIGNGVLYKSKEFLCSSVPSLGPLPIFVDGDEDTYGNRLEPNVVRDFVQVEGKFQGKALHAIGAHLKSGFGIAPKNINGKSVSITNQLEAADANIRSRMYQFSQARKLRELVDGIFANDEGAQIVVLGDFNAQEHDDTVRMIKGKLEDPIESLTNVCEGISESQRFSFVRKSKKRLIDHILVSDSVHKHLESVAILNDKLTDQSVESGLPFIVESDHAPILMGLK